MKYLHVYQNLIVSKKITHRRKLGLWVRVHIVFPTSIGKARLIVKVFFVCAWSRLLTSWCGERVIIPKLDWYLQYHAFRVQKKARDDRTFREAPFGTFKIDPTCCGKTCSRKLHVGSPTEFARNTTNTKTILIRMIGDEMDASLKISSEAWNLLINFEVETLSPQRSETEKR